VVARLFKVETPLPAAKPELQQLAASLVPRRAGDFAQAMMDLGSMICTPKNPSCLLCPWNDVCAAHLAGEPEAYPRRMPKAEGKLRKGAAFVVLRADETVLLRRRPRRGLLGGMTEVPNTEWSATFEEKSALGSAPVKAKWHRKPGYVRHVFTHFPLELIVYVAKVPKETSAPKGARFAKLTKLDDEALPSLMRKVIAHALND
jgi:A/G-specific adenine glycosylase